MAAVACVALSLPLAPPCSATVGAVAAASASEHQATVVIGTSVQGRPIRAVHRWTDGATRSTVVVGSIHGDERAGMRVVHQLRTAVLPAGVDLWLVRTMNPDGTFTGTPTRAGVTKSTITVKDARGTSDTLQVTFTTQALLAFHKTKLPKVGAVGKTYSWRLPVAGASETKIFLVSGRIPPGLELDEETGFLTGTPLTAGTFKVKFWALGDSGTQVSKTYRIKVVGGTPVVASR